MASRRWICILGTLCVLTSNGVARATEVRGLICEDTTWTAAESPYVVDSSIIVGCDAILTIEPGVEVRFTPAMALTVGHGSFGPGVLVARGTAESPILFTSDEPSPPKGDWGRIYFTDYAVDAAYDGEGSYLSGSVLEHVIVEYAGDANFHAVTAVNCSPYLHHAEVRHNLYCGIYVDANPAPSVIISNCQVWDNDSRGIYIYHGAGHRVEACHIHDNVGGLVLENADGNTVAGNTIQDNTSTHGAGIYLHHSHANAITGNTISDNTSGSQGGGIYIDTYVSGNTLSGNTISRNTAPRGGGVYISWYDTSGNTLSENWIIDNTATGEGGGIYLNGADDCTLEANVIARNHAEGAATTGGIFATDDALRLSLAGDPDTQRYNLVTQNDGCAIRNNNAFYANGSRDIDATYVRWGTNDLDAIQEAICDYFDDASKAIVLWYPPACMGDLDGNGFVNVTDFTIFAGSYPSSFGDPNYDLLAEMNGDGFINVTDFCIFAGSYGGPCP